MKVHYNRHYNKTTLQEKQLEHSFTIQAIYGH
jgi:hypothetical protein